MGNARVGHFVLTSERQEYDEGEEGEGERGTRAQVFWSECDYYGRLLVDF